MKPSRQEPTTTWREASAAGRSQPRPSRPVHCPMLALDIVAFSSRDASTQQYLRDGLYRIAKDACDAAGLPWRTCYHEDRGDGILGIAPSGISAELLDPVAAYVHAGLRRYNKLTSPAARIQLRMAIHAGYVRHDHDGVSGDDLIHLFRLLSADQFKTQLATSHTEFALITSDYLYKEIIQHGPGLIEPAAYQHITVTNKETHTDAWIWLPNTQPSYHPTSNGAHTNNN
jgi:hypothetical protein